MATQIEPDHMPLGPSRFSAAMDWFFARVWVLVVAGVVTAVVASGH